MKRILLTATMALSLTACNTGYKFALPQTTDTFGQSVTYNNKVDIVWIMDNSSSMAAAQKNLSAQVPNLAAKLLSLKMDFHMAVISTSMASSTAVVNGGKFLGSPAVLTNTTPNLASVLANWLVIGEDGSAVERGLESLEAALQPSYLQGAGRGFWRSDALLVVIPFTNEDDKSAHDVSYYADMLDRMKTPFADGSRSWMFNSITVTSLTGACKTTQDYAEISYRYIDLVNQSGGTLESICTSDFTLAMSNIHARIVDVLTEYKLSKNPIESSIVVTVNGAVVPKDSVNGWTYDSVKNSVHFHGSRVPAADAVIAVDFKPASAN